MRTGNGTKHGDLESKRTLHAFYWSLVCWSLMFQWEAITENWCGVMMAEILNYDLREVGSNPHCATGIAVCWVTVGQSHSLVLTYYTGWLFWGCKRAICDVYSCTIFSQHVTKFCPVQETYELRSIPEIKLLAKQTTSKYYEIKALKKPRADLFHDLLDTLATLQQPASSRSTCWRALFYKQAFHMFITMYRRRA